MAKGTIFTRSEMTFFQHFTYWFKCCTAQGCPWSALSKLSDHSGVGLEMPVPFLSTPAQELPREAGLCAQPPLHGRCRGTHTSARASASQVIPPFSSFFQMFGIHFVLQSFCTRAKPISVLALGHHL